MNAIIHAAASKSPNATRPSHEGSSRNLPGSLAALDGQTVLGPSGALRIVFTPKSLGPLQNACLPVHWLLPLSDCEIAAESARLSGEILWMSPRPPHELVGSLASEVQGAWWDGPIITLKWKHGVETYSIPAASHLEGSLLLLAEVASRRWVGQTPAQVQQALHQAKNRFAPPPAAPMLQP